MPLLPSVLNNEYQWWPNITSERFKSNAIKCEPSVGPQIRHLASLHMNWKAELPHHVLCRHLLQYGAFAKSLTLVNQTKISSSKINHNVENLCLNRTCKCAHPYCLYTMFLQTLLILSSASNPKLIFTSVHHWRS